MAVIGLTAPVDVADLRTRAAKGEGEALNELGNAYANGKGVPQDLAEAIRNYGLAAESGVAAAQFNLGMMHELGRGVPADPAKAFQFYQRAARQGFAPAQFNVANMYANGLGVKVDFFEAALWFRQAADRQVAEAQYNLALAYELGRGLGKDEVTAQRWYRAAAGQRFAQAQFNLALMLEEGRGSAPDPVAALELYRAAAGQNFVPAQQNLGIILADSGGGPAVLTEAYVWLALAVENGAKPTGRDIVAQKLTAPQLAEANQMLAKKRAQLGLSDRPAGATPISAAPAIVAAAPVPTSAVADVRRMADDVEVDQLRREVARFAAAAEAAVLERKQLEQKLAASELSVSTAIFRATTAEAQAKIASATRRPDDDERERLAQKLARAQASLDEAHRQAELSVAEIARLKAAPSPEVAQAPREYTVLLEQLERLTREAARLRAEKADLSGRVADLEAQASANRSAPGAGGRGAPDTRLIPLQELATADRRIAKLIADNTRLQEHVKKSVAELTELSRQLVTPEPRPDPGAAVRGATPAPATR